ncbi:transducin/WD40 repeat-like superfamily protein [Citrus sinensis]|uniref:Transducin/WD40 repeat-like superfamily protein n=1 Tax=Citrus sinensis TaxID=2711 RepID=A0ACB8MVF3_CITSI|nr:transducin/WD40 repeat-like superfamily protein [Citrus sinensis]KAH9789577.1 transducin/WD40 repeat-like superfamily protein [Citrus sinensis]
MKSNRWKRSVVELNGRFESKYRHDLSALLMQSYSQIGAFPHLYHVDRVLCPTHEGIVNSQILQRSRAGDVAMIDHRRPGISALDFDCKGIYLVSATRSGCLTVHDFESLYYQCNGTLPGVGLKEDQSKHLLHIPLPQQLDAVRWNLANQDEVACASTRSNVVSIYDIGYISDEPVEVLKTRRSVTVVGSDVQKGLSDLAFSAVNTSRLIASDTHGVVNIWDRRVGVLPSLELSTGSHGTLNSIQLHAENQIIFAAGKHGSIYLWDLRGGRTSAPFHNHKEAQSKIVSQEIHSIDLDPSCSYQLAFHLDDGWSGVLDVYNSRVSHVHCPPPAWLSDSNNSADQLHLRKPSWLSTNSIYAVGSSSDHGIHLLDFFPGSSSPSHVDYNEDIESLSERTKLKKENRFVPLSEGVTACVTHPLNNTIVAGTKNSSLLVVSQKQQCTSDSMLEQ